MASRRSPTAQTAGRRRTACGSRHGARRRGGGAAGCAPGDRARTASDAVVAQEHSARARGDRASPRAAAGGGGGGDGGIHNRIGGGGGSLAVPLREHLIATGALREEQTPAAARAPPSPAVARASPGTPGALSRSGRSHGGGGGSGARRRVPEESSPLLDAAAARRGEPRAHARRSRDGLAAPPSS